MMNAPGSLSFNRLIAERRREEDTKEVNKEKKKQEDEDEEIGKEEAEREMTRGRQDEGR